MKPTNRIRSHLIESGFKEAMAKCGFGRRTLRTELTYIAGVPFVECPVETCGVLPVAFPDTSTWSGIPTVGSERCDDAELWQEHVRAHCQCDDEPRDLCFTYYAAANVAPERTD